MTGTFFVNPAAHTQVFPAGSLPTLPRDVRCRRGHRRWLGPSRVRVSPALLYFVAITLFWGLFVRLLLGPATAKAEQLRNASEQHMRCDEDGPRSGLEGTEDE